MSQGYPEISSATASVGAEAANAITTTFQVYGADGQEATERMYLLAYLSSDANGDTPVAAGTSLAAGTDGSVIGVVEAAKTLIVATEADGDLQLVATDTGTSTRYLHLVNLATGKKLVTATLPFA